MLGILLGDMSLRSAAKFAIATTKPVLLASSHLGVTSAALQTASAVTLDGSSQYLGYTGTAFNPGVGDFTLACCFYLDRFPTAGNTFTLFNAGTVGNNQDFFWLEVNNDEYLYFMVCDGDRALTMKWSGGHMVPGQWNRVIVDLDRDGNMTMTINGTTESKGAVTQPNAMAPGNFYIGRLSGVASSYFKGRIHGALMVNRLLTAPEKAWLDNAGQWRVWPEFGVAGTDGESLTAAEVVGYYAFNDKAAAGVDSANSNTLTANGSPTFGSGIRSGVLTTHHLTQSVVTHRPISTPNSVNGFPAIDFSASSLASVLQTPELQPFTIAIVAKATAAGVILDSTSGNHCQVSRNSDSRYEFNSGTALDGTNVDAGWHTLLLVGDGDTSIISVDGNEQGGAAGAVALAGILIGQDNAGANPLAGSVAAVAVWDRVLTPAERRKVGRALANRYALQYGPLKVLTTPTTCWARIPWTSTNDYLTGMDLDVTVGRRNTVEFRDAGTVPTSTADASAAVAAVVHYESDEVTPVQVNGTYIGANHGANIVQEVTATGHDKTDADLGSEWVDAAGTPIKWYLILVKDANTLWFITSQTANWNFGTTLTGNLTHSAGATHTGGITVAAKTLTQLLPSCSHVTRAMYVNGTQLVADTGTHLCDYFDVVHQYTIKDPASLLAFQRANIGVAIDYADDAITDALLVDIRYRFQPNGAVTVIQEVTALESLQLIAFGMVQCGIVTAPGGGTVWEYVPKTVAFTPDAVEYNLSSPVDITSLAEVLDLITATWEDANVPPNHFVQLTKTSGGAKNSGMAVGYDQEYGGAVPAICFFYYT